MDHYSKLRRALQTFRMTASHIRSIIVDNLVIPYRIPTPLLTDTGTLFTSKIFQWLCTFLGSKHLRTTAYHLQINGQKERFDKKTVAGLRYYAAKHRSDWDIYVQPLIYADNSQVHHTTNFTPFSLIISLHSLASATFDALTAQSTETTTNTSPQHYKHNCYTGYQQCNKTPTSG